MNNPVLVIPDALKALHALSKAAQGAVPAITIQLVLLRASQINGCSVCVDMHARELESLGETRQRLSTIAAWHDAPWFTDAERAALALTEASSRIADRTNPVSDAVWAEAACHYDEVALSQLLLQIGLINLFNRVNVPTNQVALGKPWVAPAKAG